MGDDPFKSDVKPLKGIKEFQEKSWDYRIIFTVDFEENTIVVLRIGPGERIYSKNSLLSLFSVTFD